jgi:MscS family membrane protein
MTIVLRIGAFVLGASVVFAQMRPPVAPHAPAAQAPESEAGTDPLGRRTPRGTVTGFIEAARQGEMERAAQYLDVRGQSAQELARQLFVVLDARLPARLMRISDAPEGSGSSLSPNQEIVGTIKGLKSTQDIVLERVIRAGSPPIWLFSRATLEAIPALHDEVVSRISHRPITDFLINTRIGSLRLGDILALVLGLPAMYLITVLLSRALTALIRRIFRRSGIGANGLPVPARLLLVILAASALVATLPLSLAVRQLWSNLASLTTSVAVVWLLILVNAEVERHLLQRFGPSQSSAVASLLRLLRRGVDVLIVFAAVIVTLRHFGIDPTPALAGLGVGGIAVALAAQKTLENVIAGASLIFDKAVRVGDFLKMGDIIGTVDHIGLRSTRIRTLDRTLVSVPNGQIANASLETLSARDKFWFHPILALRFDMTPEQMHRVLEDVRSLLCEHSRIDPESVRVRFFRLGPFSFDIEVFAYLLASDWNHFLELQERLLYDVTGIVNRAGGQGAAVVGADSLKPAAARWEMANGPWQIVEVFRLPICHSGRVFGILSEHRWPIWNDTCSTDGNAAVLRGPRCSSSEAPPQATRLRLAGPHCLVFRRLSAESLSQDHDFSALKTARRSCE